MILASLGSIATVGGNLKIQLFFAQPGLFSSVNGLNRKPISGQKRNLLVFSRVRFKFTRYDLICISEKLHH